MLPIIGKPSNSSSTVSLPVDIGLCCLIGVLQVLLGGRVCICIISGLGARAAWSCGPDSSLVTREERSFRKGLSPMDSLVLERRTLLLTRVIGVRAAAMYRSTALSSFAGLLELRMMISLRSTSAADASEEPSAVPAEGPDLCR